MCAFDTGPILWSKEGFVHFSAVRARMNDLGWPHHSNARQILLSFYHIAMNYREPPIRRRFLPEDGYTLRHMRRRKYEIHERLNQVLNDIDRERRKIVDS